MGTDIYRFKSLQNREQIPYMVCFVLTVCGFFDNLKGRVPPPLLYL